MSRVVRSAAAALGLLLSFTAAASDRVHRRPLEAEVLARINAVRANPQGYADELRAFRQLFDGRIFYLPGDRVGLITAEGADAVDEAIEYLEHQAPLPPLGAGELLRLAAQDHADDQGAAGSIGHRSSDGSSPGERVRRRGGDRYVGESISYGWSDAAGVVRQLAVDDGVPGRGHRALLFTPDFRFAGIGCGAHRRHGHLCVIDLSATATGAPALPGARRDVAAR